MPPLPPTFNGQAGQCPRHAPRSGVPEKAYCSRLHCLDFSIANLFMILVVTISHGSSCFTSFFFKENVRYPVWTCNMGPDFSDSRDPIFSDSRDPMIIYSDSRDPIFNSRDPNRVPKTP